MQNYYLAPEDSSLGLLQAWFIPEDFQLLWVFFRMARARNWSKKTFFHVASKECSQESISGFLLNCHFFEEKEEFLMPRPMPLITYFLPVRPGKFMFTFLIRRDRTLHIALYLQLLILVRAFIWMIKQIFGDFRRQISLFLAESTTVVGPGGAIVIWVAAAWPLAVGLSGRAGPTTSSWRACAQHFV